MKRLTKAVLAVLVLVLPVTGAAERKRVVGTSTIWTGTYIRDDPSKNLTGRCPATGCVGDLVTCGPSESLSITKKTFSFVARVCDDRDESLPPCDGRITALAEECLGSRDVIIVAPLATLNSSGEIRFCVDSGDCSGPAPALVVGEGTVRTQTRLTAGSPVASGVSSILAKTTKDTRFRFDGEKVKFFHGRRLVDYVIAQPNHGINCGGGCSVTGVSITDQT